MKDIEPTTLIRHMVGRDLNQFFPPRSAEAKNSKKTVLELKNFTAKSKCTNVVYGPLTLSLASGEILGLGGLLGAGRSEIF